MSVRLMSLVWEIRWPTQSQLLIMLKLADYANDDGDNVRPGKPRIARQAQCSEGTVKNALRALRECGLIRVVKDGGTGPRSPTVYKINVELLATLAAANADLAGGADTIEIPDEFCSDKGSIVTPKKGSMVDRSTKLRGQSESAKGSICTPKGSKLLTPIHHLEPSIEPPSCASARKGSDSDLETVKEGDAMASLTQMMIERKCRDAAGESLDGMRLSTHDISPIIGLIEGGLSLEKDILPAIRAKASRSPPGSIRSWKLFALAVQDSVAGRKFGREAAVSAKPPLRVVDTGPKKSQAEIEREAKEFFDASLKRALEGYV